MSRRLRRLTIAFQRTSMNPINRNPPLTFGIRTTVCHMRYSASFPSWNSDCTMVITFSQLVASGESSRIAEISHWRRCSARIPEGPPKQFIQSLRTAREIYSYSGMESSTEK